MMFTRRNLFQTLAALFAGGAASKVQAKHPAQSLHTRTRETRIISLRQVISEGWRLDYSRCAFPQHRLCDAQGRLWYRNWDPIYTDGLLTDQILITRI